MMKKRFTRSIKPFTLCLCLMMCCTILSPPLTWAEDAADAKKAETGHVQEMGEVIVTATRSEIPAADIAANVTVITRDEMEKMPVANAAEVLQYDPGLFILFSGGFGSLAQATIQGSDTRHVAVYKDGVPLNQLANPLTDLSRIPIDAIEQIEIYKGAASSAWGSSLGGVINIITREPAPDRPLAGDVRASVGGNETAKASATVHGTVKGLGYLASVTHQNTRGFMDHTAAGQNSVYLKATLPIGRFSDLGFVYSYDKGGYEDPVLNYPEFWDDVKRKRTYQRLIYEAEPTDRIYLAIEGRHHKYDSTIEDVYPDHREVYSDYVDEIWGISARAAHTLPGRNVLNLGIDSDQGNYEWSNYEEAYDTGFWAAYVNDVLTLGKVSINAGLRYDDNDDFGSQASPSGGLVWRIFDQHLLIRAQAARGFSAPPAAWVHDPFYGNPDLSPETATNYQLGAVARFLKVLRLDLNLFRADIEDLISYNDDTEKMENIDEVERRGLEASLAATFDFGLDLVFGGSWIEVTDKTTDEEIKDIPTTRYRASAIYTNRWMTHSLIGNYTDHNSTYPETKDKRFVFDYLFSFSLPDFNDGVSTEIYGAVYNLFDTEYLYREVWPKPDRWGEVGVRFEF